MPNTFKIDNVTLVVVANNNNPSLLNPDFLKINNIIPNDWELERPPVCVEPMAEVVFKNSVKITTQFDKIIFFESINGKKLDKLTIPNICKEYIKTLPHVKYNAFGINFNGHLDTNNQYAFTPEKLISNGPWLTFGDDEVSAAITLKYKINNANCNVNIEKDSHIDKPGSKQPAIVIRANFHRELKAELQSDKNDLIYSYIDNIADDYNTFMTLINNAILQSGGSTNENHN